jgi:hypothetical protein
MQGADQIVQTITELKAKVPTDPHEADLLSIAEMIAEDQKPGRESERETHTHREGKKAGYHIHSLHVPLQTQCYSSTVKCVQ